MHGLIGSREHEKIISGICGAFYGNIEGSFDIIRTFDEVDEIGKQLGMRPEEVFRLSDFSKEDFLRMMVKKEQPFSKAEFITKY